MTSLSVSTQTTPASNEMIQDVLSGLSSVQKTLPSKYFYDERGSQLFDDICELDEYYVTRTEAALMTTCVREIAEVIGPNALLVEYGSGSSIKTKLLLQNLRQPAGYVPIDISGEYLNQVGIGLRSEFPHIEVLPVAADFTKNFQIPATRSNVERKVVYFPGSTIGNFQRHDALNLLQDMSDVAGQAGGILIGVDLDKDRDVLHAAYNDAKGVTAEFNLNVLSRINRELGGNFDVSRFDHKAIFNEHESRIEMHLISNCDQSVEVQGSTFKFAVGESILTEYSHKYTIDSFSRMALTAGLTARNVWSDPNEMLAIFYLERV